ncbi:AAA family ATPase [Oryzihumus sp.]
MTVLWSTDPAAAETYHYAIGGQVHAADGAHAVWRALTTTPGEPLVVAGPEIDLLAVCELAERLRVELPEAGVLLLRRRLDISVLAQALRAGIREVVVADDLSALSVACGRSLEVSRRMVSSTAGPQSRQGTIVTVFAAKGGCGKTTIATNLSAYLASLGQRVLIVDLDLAFGDVAISLQLDPEHSAADLIAMSGHLDQAGIASVVTRHASGLEAICAPSSPADADRVPATTTSELLQVARRSYDYVIVDTPPAFTEHTLAAFDVSDIAIMLATPDIPAVKNLRLALNTLDLLGHPQESRVVVLNRADAKVGLHVPDVVKAIRAPVATSLPSSPAVPASVNRGVALVLDEPKHEFSTALRALAEQHVVTRTPVPPLDAPAAIDQQPLPRRRDLRQRRRKVLR